MTIGVLCALGGGLASADALLSSAAATAPPTTYTLFPANAVPAVAAATDTKSVELGVKFAPDVDGVATGMRFYKGTTNIGTHVGTLWSSAGAVIARVTFANETASGWQTAMFATPIALSASQQYVVSYHAPSGHYAYTYSYFTNRMDNGTLHAFSSAESGGNGVYTYGASTLAAPASSSTSATNYWVDVLFNQGAVATTTTSTTIAPTTTTTAAPTTTTTKPPVTTTTTTTVPPAGPACPTGWSVGAPCAANTGVPASVTLKPIVWNATAWGSHVGTVSVAGATISGYDIPYTLDIEANNVKIINDRVHVASPGVHGGTAGHPTCPCSSSGAMIGSNNWDGGNGVTGLQISYTEIDCGGTTSQTGPTTNKFLTPYGVQEGLEYGHYRADHVNVHGCGNDAVMRTDTHITSSYLWGLSQNSACFTDAGMDDNTICDHLDTVEVTTGTVNTGGTTSDLTGNYLVGDWNSCIWTSTNGGTISNFTFAKNWCAADGTYFAYKSQHAAGGNFVNVKFQNNRAVRYPQGKFGLNPDAGWLNLDSSTSNCGLVYDDNNALVVQSGSPNPAC